MICTHAEIEYNEGMMNVEKIGSSIVADSKSSRGIDRSYSSRWKEGGLSRREILVCQFVCRKLMQYHSYESAWSFLELPATLFSIPEFSVKALMAIALNLGRSKSLFRQILNRIGVS